MKLEGGEIMVGKSDEDWDMVVMKECRQALSNLPLKRSNVSGWRVESSKCCLLTSVSPFQPCPILRRTAFLQATEEAIEEGDLGESAA